MQPFLSFIHESFRSDLYHALFGIDVNEQFSIYLYGAVSLTTAVILAYSYQNVAYWLSKRYFQFFPINFFQIIYFYFFFSDYWPKETELSPNK